jgi:hypothetical protein
VQSENQKIQHKLLSIWRRERRLFHSRGACQALLCIVGLVLFDLAIDWLLELPGWARVLLVCFNVAVLAWIGYQQWWRFLRGYNPLHASLAAERVHPELNSLLVSYVQLSSEGGTPANASPQLTEALCQQAVQKAAPMDFRAVVDFRQITKLAVIAAVVVLAFGVSTIFAGPFYRVLAIRLTNPASDLGYPTRTVIESTTGDLIVRQGDPLEVTVTVDQNSEVPQEAILEIQHGDGPWERVIIDDLEAEPARFNYPIQKSTSSFVYRFRAGDTKTKYHEVTVVPAPQIVESTIKLQYPKYTALGSEEISSLNFEVLEGATVEWEIRCDQELASAEMTCEPGETIQMTIDENDPHIVRAALKADQTLAYQFKWTEKLHDYTYADKVRYSLRVTIDESPLVDILPPRPAEVATLKKNLDIRYRARDEYGLGEAWIVYQVNDGVEHEHALGDLSGRNDVQEIEWQPQEWISNLTENDTLTYAIKVTDNRVGERGPNSGRSKPLRLQFLSREDYLKSVQETRNELFSNIKGIQEDEVDSSNTIKALKSEIKP